MSTLFTEIRILCDVLEAELEGRPFDRDVAKDLADRLGQKFPSIQNSMKQLCDRFGNESELAEANAA